MPDASWAWLPADRGCAARHTQHGQADPIPDRVNRDFTEVPPRKKMAGDVLKG